MIEKEVDGIKWLEFELLADIPNIKHAILSRNGGYSKGSFESLNLAFNFGDNDEDVQKNLLKISARLSFPSIIWANARHGNKVDHVTYQTLPNTLPCDAIATDLPGITLMTKHADCQAALIYDPIKHVAANVHSGWRGSVANIYHNTVNFLVARYQCSPSNLLVAISPSLGPKHAEFKNYLTELPHHFLNYKINECHFNFWEISRDQLESSGILPHHIQIAEICTYENEQDYFSYRRDRVTGRNGSFIALL